MSAPPKDNDDGGGGGGGGPTVDSEPSYAQSQLDKTTSPWYVPNIDRHLIPETRKLLQEYSGIPPGEQSKHVHDIRDRAWSIRQYPCTGLGVFLDPYIRHSPAYEDTLETLRSGGRFLDVGCFIGIDMRRLVFDGAPSTNMYGIDIVSHWEVGYDMFRDRRQFGATYIQADLLSAGTPAADPKLATLKGTVDVIHISAVLHQWPWKTQVQAACVVVSFSKPGSVVVGYQIGNVNAGVVSDRPVIKAHQWRHDPESMAKMWEEVGRLTNTEWKTKARMKTWKDMGWDGKDIEFMDDGDMVLDFVVTRLK